MTVEIPYALVLVAVTETVLFTVGALIGCAVVLVRIRGERRGLSLATATA